MRIRQTIHRSAFTLVELLVATALIMFIMAIIAQMFGSGSKTFSNMRNAAHLSSNARTGINVIRMDLGREKFGSPTNPGGGEFVMLQRLDHGDWQPPFRGYFELFQGDPNPVLFEPTAIPGGLTDGEGIYSTRSANHRMRFTMKLPDLQTAPADLLCAQYHQRLASELSVNLYPPFSPTIYSQWAEVCYFVLGTGDSTPTGLPLFTLRRRVRLLPKETSPEIVLNPVESTQVENARAAGTYPDVIDVINLGPAPTPPYPAGSTRYRIPGPEALNDPTSGVARIPYAAHPTGDDILLTDVLSFEIKAAWYHNPGFESARAGTSPQPDRLLAGTPTLTDEPFSVLKPSAFPPYSANIPPMRFFDTGYVNGTVDWTNPTSTTGFLQPLPGRPPTRINIRALQIKLRIWDAKAEQARQVTIVHEI